ncbi:hypothetical protein [Allofrancisella frigidaquae]|uniref:Uncharacterized protein n=1 Tax=Allofrancisella frigidaquae TaxID=1085644 RepID=A0A6M3HVL6_9GAMM|nr:hypothetical protein [Allofrancisella frigidaquae]QIV94242.1 hypothetical protein E3E15_02280 [Allofrancisella frigidaquae]
MVVLSSVVILAGCTNPSDNNDALLQNSLLKSAAGQVYQFVSISNTAIPGFENSSSGSPYTQVTVTYSGGAEAARAAKCSLLAADLSTITSGLTATTVSFDTGGDSALGGLDCGAANQGNYSADITISFIAGGVSYTATTTLEAKVGPPA